MSATAALISRRHSDKAHETGANGCTELQPHGDFTLISYIIDEIHYTDFCGLTPSPPQEVSDENRTASNNTCFCD